MKDLRWVPAAAALGFGVSAAGLAYWLVSAISAVPPEDRTWRDRPPLTFRLVWWPILWIAHYLGPALSIGYRQRWLQRLRSGGLDYALSPEQFLAARLIAAGIGALLLDFIVTGFGRSPGLWPVLGTAIGYVFPVIWLRDQIALRKRQT